MKNLTPCLLLAAVVLLCSGIFARAQDSVTKEPIDPSIEVSKLTYDYLVDGDLAQDDPANNKFKTLQAAYAAAPAGTESKPTVIGIKPNVYLLPGGARTPSLRITKNYITLLGLTNNRRTVVLADNRGLQQGSDDDGYILDVNATGFTLKNLTVVNFCNNDYEYPGNPSKNLHRRSDVITQGVALQAAGDKHVLENVALLGRLDTMFLRATRSYFKNVYLEGTDDFVGGGTASVWENCEIYFPIGRGVMSASGITFINCKFDAARGLQFYKVEYGGAARPDVLINCTMPVSTPQAPVAWNRGLPPPRPTQLSLTYHVKDTSGQPAVIYDSNVGPPTFTYSRELSDQEALAFNPWNLLRFAANGQPDDWDPAGVRTKYEAAGNLIYRMTLTNGGGGARGGRGGAAGGTAGLSTSATLRTGGPGTTFNTAVFPATAPDKTITWSTDSKLVALNQASGPTVTVTAQNQTNEAQWVPVKATAANGFYLTGYVYSEPKYIDPPTFTAPPKINPSANGQATVSYALDLGGRPDQSIITWYICDDLQGANSREIAVSRGNEPLTSLPLTTGYVGKYLLVSIQPKHHLCEPGPPVTAITAAPVAAADVPLLNVSPNFRNFPTTPNDTYASGLWSVIGTWASVTGDAYVNGYGVRPSTVAYLLYQQDADCGDMQVDLTMYPEKTEGTGFSVPGSPAESGGRNLHSDIYIKFDPRTRNGYALRFWRTTQSAAKCMYQLYKIENGVGSPLNDQQVLTGVFKPTTHLTMTVTGTTLTVTANNTVDNETLSLQGTITPNRFGGAGVFWPGGSTNTYSQIGISYPGTAGK
jgi:hypothetical protein